MNNLWRWLKHESRYIRSWLWHAPADTFQPVSEWTMDPREVEFCRRTGRYLEIGGGDA